jgi:hypothetical protein
MEAPSGLEPLNRGFADLSLSHLGTTPLGGVHKACHFMGSLPISQYRMHDDFVQASELNRLNNFSPYLVGYIYGKNWSFVICYWLFVIFLDQKITNNQ